VTGDRLGLASMNPVWSVSWPGGRSGPVPAIDEGEDAQADRHRRLPLVASTRLTRAAPHFGWRPSWFRAGQRLLLDDEDVDVRVLLDVAGKLRGVTHEAEIVYDEHAAVVPAAVTNDVVVDLPDHLLLAVLVLAELDLDGEADPVEGEVRDVALRGVRHGLVLASEVQRAGAEDDLQRVLDLALVLWIVVDGRAQVSPDEVNDLLVLLFLSAQPGL
jgi:hypothetical protein